MALAHQEAAELISQVARDLHHQALVGLRRDASDVNNPLEYQRNPIT
jgi:hypothetical protein